MIVLVLGLVLFLGIHSVRILAPNKRDAWVQALGEGPWKGLYSLIALAGFVLIIWGYGLARGAPTWVWVPPVWTRHVAAALLIPAMIFLVAAYIPGSHMKAKLGHPMVLGVKVWAFAHLLSNGTVHDLLLFGGFLVWSIVAFASLRRRDRANGVQPVAGSLSRDAIAVVIGLGVYGAFAFVLHGWLIGVQPFG